MGFLSKLVKGAGKVFKSLKKGSSKIWRGLTSAVGVKGLGSKLLGRKTAGGPAQTYPVDAWDEGPVQQDGLWSNIWTSAKKVGGWLADTGIANVAGDIYSGKQMQNSSREQMAFQERMASTQHQREVADLKAAGLNPMLSGTGGAGAASPSGASYGVPDYGATVNSALQSKLLRAQIENVRAQTMTQHATTGNVQSQTEYTRTQTDKEQSGSPYWGSNARENNRKLVAEISGLELSNRMNYAEVQKVEALVERVLKNPDLQGYILSAPWADQKNFEKILKGNGDAGNYIRAAQILKTIFR